MTEAFPRLPKLKILAKLGEGGMSTVWKAYDEERDEIVAVKILNRNLNANSEDIALFTAEEQTMELVDHPGIVKSYRLANDGERLFYVMEYVDGYNFNSLLQRKHHLVEVDCLLICESVAVALEHAWLEHGIVHCDIKPENIMINTDGIVKLTDLGLSHTFNCENGGLQEIPEHVMGTPAYISPEQVYGDLEPDCRADIYSLGAAIYHLATGRVLFAGLDNEGQMRSHCDESCQANDPRAYNPALSKGFAQMLEAMLVKNRDNRLQDWEDVITMCREVERGAVFTPRDTPGASSIRLM